MKNVFYLVLKALFENRLDSKDKVNFKVHDVTTCLTNNSNTPTAQYLTKERQPGNEI